MCARACARMRVYIGVREGVSGVDTFFSGNNGARMILCGSNDLFVQAESNDTHYDHDLKIFGSRLGHYVPYTSHRLKKTENPVSSL